MKKSFYDFCIENKKPELLSQWDSEINGNKTPQNVSYGSGKKVWWRCEKGHIWEACVNSRSNGSGCPVCSGRTVQKGENDLATEFPYLALQWHPVKNFPLTAEQITRGSCRLIWWRCEKNHEWRAAVKSRTEGKGCPVCAGKKLIPGENDLASVRPDLALEWNFKKNGALAPDMLLASSARRVWWICERGHEWQAMVKARMNGTGCPFCSGRKVMEGVNDLASLYPETAGQWHPLRNGKMTPREISGASNRRVWWICEKGHEWRATVYCRTQSKTRCPYCTNRKVLAGFNDLATLEPEISKQWHPTLNDALTPHQVTPGSKKKIWWICSDGHIWKASVYARTGSQRSGCPVCAGNAGKNRRK